MVPRRDQSVPREILGVAEKDLCSVDHSCVSLYSCYARFFTLCWELEILPQDLVNVKENTQGTPK